MDGWIITTIIASSMATITTVVVLFFRLGHQIGKLEGRTDELNIRMHSYERQLAEFDKRIDRLDRRMNGLLDKIISNS